MKKLPDCIVKKIPLLLALFMLGCAVKPPPAPQLPAAEHIKSLILPRTETVALHPQGAYLALVAGGVQLIETDTGTAHSLASVDATLLAWNPSGDRLALAFAEGETTRIRVVDPAGETLSEQELEGVGTALLWRGEELLAASYALTVYSFGGNLKHLLHRLGADGSLRTEVLHDVTLKPVTVRRFGGLLKKAFQLALSPYGDEIVYTRLQDPPLFSPYIQVVLRHLETGRERPVGKMTQGVGAVLYAAGGEQVLFGDGVARTVLVDPWNDREVGSYDRPGGVLGGSSNGHYLGIDNVLYYRGKEVAAPAGDHRLFFAGPGDCLVAIKGRAAHIYRLNDGAALGQPSAAQKERVQRLRSWRSQGLIDQQEYLEQKEEVLRHEK